jgi:tetratricopeptide (TPR) repeat protein
LEQHKLLVEPVQILQPFVEDEDIKAYLEAYGIVVSEADERITRIKNITEGRPLLLTCYVEAVRPDTDIPPGINIPDTVEKRVDFENYIVEEILNPFQGRNQRVGTFLNSLFFLSIARRGIRRSGVLRLFEQMGYTDVDREVVERLEETALVKTLPVTKAANNVTTDDIAEDMLFFLHDEIYQMIDESSITVVLGLVQPSLEYLVEFSKQQVRQTRRRREELEASTLLQAMSDHIYYAMTRDIVEGYRTYTIYTDQLLDERNINSAFIVSDTFWSILNRRVRRRDHEGKEEEVQPYCQRLEEVPGLTYAEIIRDEQVRRVKLLDAHDNNREAMHLADKLYGEFEQDGQLAQDQYLFVDLSLIRAVTTTMAEPFGFHEMADQLFSEVIDLLEQSEETIIDEFLRLRRKYFVGQAYSLRGFLRRQQQRFAEARADAQKARELFKSYMQEEAITLNDDIITALAQVTNNLAYSRALSGSLRLALRLSEEVLDNYVALCSSYQRALFYNTNAIILLRLGRYLQAQRPLEMAKQAAEISGSRRAKGLVLRTVALLESEISRAGREISPEVEQHFEAAVQWLSREPDALRDVYSEWSSFVRELALFYKDRAELNTAEGYKQKALHLIEEALKLTPEESSIQRADLLRRKIAVHLFFQEHDQASELLDQAKAMLSAAPVEEFGHVVSGNIAMQQALIESRVHQNYQSALSLVVIALGRMYLFARQHRDQENLENQIDQFIREFPEIELRAFQQSIAHQQVVAPVGQGELAYQQPDTVLWSRVWQGSSKFVIDSITTQLDMGGDFV